MTSEGAVLPEDVRPIFVSARHGTDVEEDQLDKDVMEYAVKLVRPVSICIGKTSYRFGLLKVELKKENIEKNTPALSISGRITLHIIVNVFGIETEFESLFCTDRPTSFECINRFDVAVSNDTWIQSNNVEANFGFHRSSVFGVRFLLVKNRFFQDTSQDVSQDMWQTQTAHQSQKNYECDDYIFEFETDYIFVFATELNKNITIELDDALEENCMTVYVNTINGKTIIIKCDKIRKQLL